MNTGMQERLRLFDENNRLFSQKYWYGWSGMNAISALFFTNEGRTADIAKVEECRQMVKTKVGIFSNIRGNLIRPLCVRAALSQNPDAYLDGVIEAYKAIQKGKVLRSEFEVLAAIILYENCDPKNYDHIAEEIWNTYRNMRRDHPLLTAREDMGMATLLTVSEKDTQMLLEEMEQCYRLLKPDFAFRGNEIQTMSALLSVLEGLPAEKCEKVKAICDALKAHRVSLNFRECLPLAAGLIVGEDSPDQIAADIAEAAEWLRHKRGFSWLTQGKHGRITFSMLLYMNDCIGKRKLTENAVSTALSSIILMEVLITMLILLAPVTASASSDN